jgi:hypothetical protein
MATLMRDLAAGLEGEQDESAVQSTWRQVYTSRQLPPLTLGPITVKDVTGQSIGWQPLASWKSSSNFCPGCDGNFGPLISSWSNLTCFASCDAGKGRGLFTTAAVAPGDLLLVAAPLALLYCEEGTTPEIEELAEALAAAVAATASGLSGGLEGWQQQALLQLRPAGAAAAATPGGQPGSNSRLDLLQLLGPSEAVTAAAGPAEEPAAAAAVHTEQQQQQQQQEDGTKEQYVSTTSALPAPDHILKLVFANCTGESIVTSYDAI